MGVQRNDDKKNSKFKRNKRKNNFETWNKLKIKPKTTILYQWGTQERRLDNILKKKLRTKNEKKNLL